ncbi:toprim domain-containing protein [Klebsiella pneumoniae subsp. pneumoniae]|nr:toprim domain-containing protein [Klebsiella pneumoniae subsp. pneumoniae]
MVTLGVSATGRGEAQPGIYVTVAMPGGIKTIPVDWVPEKWQLQPRSPSVTKQLNVIHLARRRRGKFIHAGDPDREGQLPGRSALDHLQLAVRSVSRCGAIVVINDLPPAGGGAGYQTVCGAARRVRAALRYRYAGAAGLGAPTGAV